MVFLSLNLIWNVLMNACSLAATMWPSMLLDLRALRFDVLPGDVHGAIEDLIVCVGRGRHVAAGLCVELQSAGDFLVDVVRREHRLEGSEVGQVELDVALVSIRRAQVGLPAEGQRRFSG